MLVALVCISLRELDFCHLFSSMLQSYFSHYNPSWILNLTIGCGRPFRSCQVRLGPFYAMSHMHLRRLKLIQDQRALDQAKY